MIFFSWVIAFIFVFCVLAYNRASLVIWTISFAFLLIFLTKFQCATVGVILSWILFLVIFVPLDVVKWRRRFFSKPLLDFYLNVMPTMSRTERQAISAGTVTWEGDLFRGDPNWDK